MSTFKKLKYWLPALSYMLLIFTLSSRSIQAPYIKLHTDKLIHFFEYAFLSTLIYYALLKSTKYNTLMLILLSIAITTTYGITDEIHQSFVPNRTCDIMDALFDFLGSITIFITSKKINSGIFDIYFLKKS